MSDAGTHRIASGEAEASCSACGSALRIVGADQPQRLGRPILQGRIFCSESCEHWFSVTRPRPVANDVDFNEPLREKPIRPRHIGEEDPPGGRYRVAGLLLKIAGTVIVFAIVAWWAFPLKEGM
ncbi:hypothetical protein [Amorphus sp. 3PC139-8]|uniref:hypothetical protein n=1 Tax=Amorphus sp. 3PC139-8 TaxID=2735676 RepID=UPI00345D8DAE